MLRLYILILTLSLAACSESPTGAGSKTTDPDGITVLEWTDLMPEGYDPSKVLPDADFEYLSDSDPNAQRYLRQMREAWSEAPVVETLNERQVRIPGFVVPVEYDDKNVSEFLLVPYFGACIHTPPPPANQIVYVNTGGFGPSPEMLWDPVWVSGTLKTERVDNELGDAGYTLDAVSITPYELDEESDTQGGGS